MDHIIDIRMRVKDFVEGRFIRDIDVVESRSNSGNELDAVDDLVRGVSEIINDDYLIVGFEKRDNGERANITGPTEQVSDCSREQGSRLQQLQIRVLAPTPAACTKAATGVRGFG